MELGSAWSNFSEVDSTTDFRVIRLVNLA